MLIKSLCEDNCYSEKATRFGICVRDQSGEVIQQNDLSIQICGNRKGLECELCDTQCHGHRPNDADEGLKFGQSQAINGVLCDIAVISDLTQKVTTIFPLEKALSVYRTKIDSSCLTAREKEIAHLVVEGKRNHEIMAVCDISKPTLRTHLMHIYRKEPDLKNIRDLNKTNQ